MARASLDRDLSQQHESTLHPPVSSGAVAAIVARLRTRQSIAESLTAEGPISHAALQRDEKMALCLLQMPAEKKEAEDEAYNAVDA